MALVVPHLVGDLQLQEDILVNKLDLGVEVAVVFAIFGEVPDDSVDDLCEAYQLHDNPDFPHQLLLPLAQLSALKSFVAIVHTILLSFSQVLHLPYILLHLLDHMRKNGSG